uniref:Uncharacterized protein n=1 Tax=Anopheles braziliensis TaxID=58242 RepID=A0A2M3ZJM2_9DIPT
MWFTGYCCGVKGRARTPATEERCDRSKPGAVMGCTPSILSNGSNNQQQQQSRKDSSGLYAGNVAAAAAAAAAASGNGSSSHGNECGGTGGAANNNKLGTVNQTMLNAAFPAAKDGGTEKESAAKKDSIVSISASGHITSFPIVSATVRRPTAGSKLRNLISFCRKYDFLFFLFSVFDPKTGTSRCARP